jgi:hypothetical protein
MMQVEVRRPVAQSITWQIRNIDPGKGRQPIGGGHHVITGEHESMHEYDWRRGWASADSRVDAPHMQRDTDLFPLDVHICSCVFQRGWHDCRNVTPRGPAHHTGKHEMQQRKGRRRIHIADSAAVISKHIAIPSAAKMM